MICNSESRREGKEVAITNENIHANIMYMYEKNEREKEKEK